MTETTEQPVSTSTAARSRRGDGLSGMVLADLKAMATQLGIKGTSGLRKGDLVSAIESRQNSAAPTATNAPASGSAAPAASERPTRRRAAGRPEGAPDVAGTTAAAPPADTAPPAQRNAGATELTPSTDGHTDAASSGHREDLPNGGSRNGAQRDAATRDAASGEGADHARPNGSGPDGAARAAVVEIAVSRPESQQSGTDQGATESGSGQNGGHDRQERPTYDGDDGPRSSRRNRRNRRDRDRGGDGAEQQTDGGSSQNGQAPANGGQNGGQATATRDQSNRDQPRDGQRNGQDRNGRQDRNGQDRNGQDRNAQDRNGQDRNGQDEDVDGRRGRRFRDRNRRTRDRFADAPTDTEVRDDDVLVPVAGIVDVLDSYAFIRTSGYLSGPNDVYVSLSQIRKNGLRRGDAVTGAVRAPRDGETAATRQKFNALVRLDSVNGQDPELAKDRPEFTKLTPLYPNDRLRLETESHILTTRIIDLVMPVGKGQRALIVSPPKAGKTSILQAIANAITTNNPEVHLMVVLVDERPEEVTDMQRSVKGEVIASTFDRPPADHTMVAELSIERAKRLVEMGRDVVVLLDSITRLGRAYNLAAPASGRILSGGVDSTALFPPKRFLGAARNIENGGSLTIFASALVETGSAGDTVIFEEFKGTGNAELKLDRRIADKRIFPAIDVDQSSTRKEDLLLSPDELAITVKLRRVLAALDSQQALELLLDRLRKTRSNVEFLMQVAKNAAGVGSNND